MPNRRDTVLNVENLSVTGKHGEALKNISFNVRAGEIVGIAGIEGNGQTELVEAIAGLLPASNGKITLSGKDITNFSVRRRTELGIGHIPEDRHKRGLLLDSDLEENAILGVHYRAPVASVGFMNSAVIEKRTKEIIENFDVRPPNPNLRGKIAVGRQSAKTYHRQGI